jgi:hypothetical protein
MAAVPGISGLPASLYVASGDWLYSTPIDGGGNWTKIGRLPPGCRALTHCDGKFFAATPADDLWCREVSDVDLAWKKIGTVPPIPSVSPRISGGSTP